MRLPILLVALVLLFSVSVFAQNNLKSMSEVSMTAPAFEATAMSGKTYKLEDLRGKVVVLNFWSTSCFICASETPDLNALVDSYAGKEVIFLGFAHDSKEKVEKFLKKIPFKYEIFPASLNAMIVCYGKPQDNGFYDIPFPLHILIDKEGVIQVNETGLKGAAAVKERLAKIFAENNNTAIKMQ